MERAEGSELFQALANLMNSAPFNLLSGAARESLKKKKKKEMRMARRKVVSTVTEALLLHGGQGKQLPNTIYLFVLLLFPFRYYPQFIL